MNRTAQSGRRKSVLVLGAGLAGLAAAYELTEAGHDVTVLEARTRAGGRALTLRNAFADGLHAEAGAKFVHQNHPLVIEYAGRFNLELLSARTLKLGRMSDSLYYLRGAWLQSRDDELTDATGRPAWWPLNIPAQVREAPLALMIKYAAPVLTDPDFFGDPSSDDWPPETLKTTYDGLSFEQFLRQRGASDDAIELMRLSYIDLAGDGIGSLSALWTLRELYFTSHTQDSFWLVDGSDALPDAFASRLTAQLRYGSPVTRIDQHDGGVSVTYRQAGSSGTLSADYAVCTLPFSVLGTIEMTPPVSEGKRRAIAELPYTATTAVYLQLRSRAWQERGTPGVAMTDLPITYALDMTWYQPGTRSVLMSLTAGARARALAAMDEQARQATVLDQMEKLYPGVRDCYEGGASYAWELDPWALGGYSWMRPGQFSSIHPHIGTPEGRIFFAGEHASPWPAWMEGALWSGKRAAEAIIAAE